VKWRKSRKWLSEENNRKASNGGAENGEGIGRRMAKIRSNQNGIGINGEIRHRR